ncbi:transcriptional repressor [Cymbomonas tetramitiformis]|uniref:Transcriptional repressor n=1 Tax=Cymbomonas tetramitiformis TaxID=36881 RepID=A0AAE0C817_9CHLO|nr:transcriptional repressor [Cymbomonas tetramitiformis]
MWTIPSLRARDCSATEKEALNYAFVGVPLINILIPFVWKSFPAVFSADVLMMIGLYAWKGVNPLDDQSSSEEEVAAE